MSGHSPSDVPPQVVVSELMSEPANTGNIPGLRKEAQAPLAVVDERKQSSPVWVDVDEERPRRRRKSRRSTSESTSQDRSARPKHSSNAQGDIGRFLPRLSRILEAADPNVRQRSYHGSDQKRDLDEKSRSTRYRDENDYGHRHSTKRRTSIPSRRPEPIPIINPSLVSVLSSLTSASDRSSGSNSTITQQSYDRKKGLLQRKPSAHSKETVTATEAASNNMPRKSPNVFDYMEDVTNTANIHDGMPVISPASSASSQYQPSDAGSSEVSTTPSSRSTLPSPTTTRSVSVAELRRKYDPDYAGLTSSPVDINNVESSTRSLRQQRSYKNSRERMVEEPIVSTSTASMTSALDFNDGHRQSSHSSLRALDDEQRLRQQEEEMRRHMAQSQHPYAYEYTPAMDSSPREDSPEPQHAEPSTHQSLEHYIHQPVPSRPAPSRIVRSTPSPPQASPPHAPDAPDLTKTTLTGYELLASHLTSSQSNASSNPAHVTPLYRTFSQLHHRVLLHLQDELAEKESQLRILDESIAQTYTSHPTPTGDSPTQLSTPEQYPASRRAERNPNYHPIFARRTQLLGEIYIKQQQYHSALRDYAATVRDSRPAEQSEVAAYKSFLAERKPIWEGETGFLDKLEDLVVPAGGSSDGRAGLARITKRTHTFSANGRNDALWEQASFLAALLLLPLLISTVLPDFASRAAATALLGAGAALVIWGARLRGGNAADARGE